MEKFINENGKEREDVFYEDSLIRSFNDRVEKSDCHVFGLTGEWGSGKTTFMGFWESFVKEQKKAEYSILHVNAFSKDYVEDPFSMLLDVFIEFMRENDVSPDMANGFVEKAKRVGFSILKSVAYAFAQKITGGLAHDICEKFIDEYQYDPSTKTMDPCEELKTELKRILESTKRKLYIVIDELDRCRPDFALECLERIKHLFVIDGIKFILIYNPKVFIGIVKNRYGCDERSARFYIHKFVERELPFSLDIREGLSRFIEYELSFVNPSDANGVNRIKSVLYSSHTIARVLIDFNITSLREVKFLNNSILDLLKDIQIRDEYYKLWYIIALLKLLDYEEYEGIVSYLAMNKHFSSNIPKRVSFIKIAKYFMSNKDDSEIIKLFEDTFENYRYKF